MLLFLLFVSVVICNGLNWTISNDTLPIPICDQCIGTSKEGNIFLFGGYPTNIGIWKWNGKLPVSFETINGKTPTSTFRCFGQQTVCVDNLVYIIGVYDGSWNSGKIYIYDMNNEEFISTDNIPKMPIPSIYGCVATNNKLIYYVGGRNDTNIENQIQIFNISSQKWNTEIIPTLPKTFYGSSCMIINDTFYSFGGWNGTTQSEMSEVFKYNITSNKVFNEPISYLTEKRWGSKAINLNDDVYIIGGLTAGSTIIGSQRVDVFDAEKEEILTHNISNLKIGVSETSVAMINYSIMTFGGYYRYNGGDGETAYMQISNQLTTL